MTSELPEPPPELLVERAVRNALTEDLGDAGDITTDATIARDATSIVRIVARKPGRIAGLVAARMAFRLLDPEIRIAIVVPDGRDAEAGGTIAALDGRVRPILTGERVALNFLGHLSGIATLTAQYVAAVAGTKARITCTRKTTPGLRALEKYAVRCGGGVNHRFGLYDGLLIKDNHVAAAGGIIPAIERARAHAGHMVRIEIEVDRLSQLEEALSVRADTIMLDNMSLADMAEAVRLTAGRARLEASGGVSLSTVRAIAETGVDLISVGALTHSAPNLDVALDY